MNTSHLSLANVLRIYGALSCIATQGQSTHLKLLKATADTQSRPSLLPNKSCSSMLAPRRLSTPASRGVAPRAILDPD